MTKLKGKWIEIDLATGHIMEIVEVEVDSESPEPYTSALMEYVAAIGMDDEEAAPFINDILFHMEDTGIDQLEDTSSGIKAKFERRLYLFIWN